MHSSCSLDFHSRCDAPGTSHNIVQLSAELDCNFYRIYYLLLSIQCDAETLENGVTEHGITRFSKLTSSIESVTINSRNRFLMETGPAIFVA